MYQFNLQKIPIFVGLGVVGVTVVFVALHKYFTSTGSKKHPIALDPNKKIAFKMIEKEV